MSNTVRIGTRPKRGQSYTAWKSQWQAIFDRMLPFATAGALQGYPADVDRHKEPLPLGHRLSVNEEDVWDADADSIVYVVLSYRTPIAWMKCEPFGEPEWHFVEQKFSVTTSKHQSLIRGLLS